MTAPIVSAAGEDPENTVLYQRELLFGPPSVGYRADGLALVVELEEAIAERLSTAITQSAVDCAIVGWQRWSQTSDPTANVKRDVLTRIAASTAVGSVRVRQ